MEGIWFDSKSTESIFPDSESSVARVNAIKPTLLSSANKSNEACSDSTQAILKSPLGKHPRPETHKKLY